MGDPSDPESGGDRIRVRDPCTSAMYTDESNFKIEDESENHAISVTEDIKEDTIEYKTSEEKADLILVNNTIIDNQMFHGDTQCYIEYRGKMYCVEKGLSTGE